MRARWYVGMKVGSVEREAFTACGNTPTPETHGHLYAAVLGPFRTRRGAKWAEAHSAGNPHVLTVADAERIASTGGDARR